MEVGSGHISSDENPVISCHLFLHQVLLLDRLDPISCLSKESASKKSWLIIHR